MSGPCAGDMLRFLLVGIAKSSPGVSTGLCYTETYIEPNRLALEQFLDLQTPKAATLWPSPLNPIVEALVLIFGDKTYKNDN